MKAIGVAVAMMAVASGAQAQDWVIGGIADSAIQAYDQSAIVRTGHLRSVWVLSVFADTVTEIDGIGEFDYYLSRNTYDCQNFKSGFGAIRIYKFGQEAIVFRSDITPVLEFLGPGSMAEETARLVCSGEPLESFGFTRPHELAGILRTVLVADSDQP